MILHASLIVASIFALAQQPPLWAALLLSLVIGHSFAGLAFVGHETMHGAVVRSSWLRYAIGVVCFLPFSLPPRLWVAWHNRVHHGNTMKVGVDPDAYPTLEQYHESRLTRVADFFSVGSGRLSGLVTLLVGFTGQSSQMMWRHARGMLSRRDHRLAVVERVLAVGFWVTLGVLLGGHVFLFAFVLPLVVANAIVIMYILTNHSLSPLTDVNDPLVNSLTVTAPAFIEKLHLNFGLHVEHHLFPSMSSAHAPKVRALLIQHWPERYQSLPLWTALWRLWRTPRVYQSPTRLVDPTTGAGADVLLPGVAPAVENDGEALTPAPAFQP
jgi:fatty acid desaturase